MSYVLFQQRHMMNGMCSALVIGNPQANNFMW